MEANNHILYSVKKSAERMDEILDASNSNFENKKSIPSRDSLTFTNGYYVDVATIFVDMVGSSDMTDEHRRPTLAKIYRSFISECVAIMNSRPECKEINIHGDCVWGVFDTPMRKDIDGVFHIAYSVNSLIRILNYKLRKKNYTEISIGIGIDYGRALMIKSGYSGSSINDVIWMGDVVNSASNLCSKAGRNGRKPIIVSSVIYQNLNDHNQKLLTSYYDPSLGQVYVGDIINLTMEEWYEENCK